MPSTALLFESKLVTFCSPTLLKMKAGNILDRKSTRLNSSH